MPLDPKEFEKVFANHFEKISPEQFLDNLKAACPYLFEKDSTVALQDINSQEDLSKPFAVYEPEVKEIAKWQN
jgi:hypothetical protein